MVPPGHDNLFARGSPCILRARRDPALPGRALEIDPKNHPILNFQALTHKRTNESKTLNCRSNFGCSHGEETGAFPPREFHSGEERRPVRF